MEPHLRREGYGELIQIDGSDHRWFEQRGEPCTLLVFIDDATSKLMQLRFVASESTDSYFGAPHGYLAAYGYPAEGLTGQIYQFADRPLEVRWKGHSLPYRVFSKDQRVSHTAIVENKRLSHALTIVKTQQDVSRMPTLLTNSAKRGYRKRGRQLYGPDYVAKMEGKAPAPKLWKYAKSPKAAISHIPTARRR